MCGPVYHEDSLLDNMAVCDQMVVSKPCWSYHHHKTFGCNKPHLMPRWAHNSLVNRHFVHTDHPWFQSIIAKSPVVHLFPFVCVDSTQRYLTSVSVSWFFFHVKKKKKKLPLKLHQTIQHFVLNYKNSCAYLYTNTDLPRLHKGLNNGRLWLCSSITEYLTILISVWPTYYDSICFDMNCLLFSFQCQIQHLQQYDNYILENQKVLFNIIKGIYINGKWSSIRIQLKVHRFWWKCNPS